MSIESDFIWAPAPSTTRGQPTILSADSKGERLAFASNKSIFIRQIDTPTIGRQYTAHTAQTSVARFSPSGFYVASGDVAGTVRIWDCVGEGATKGEYHIISGRINDIAWDGDSQRVIAVGDGRERYGKCITADSGNSVGEISGHTAIVNAVSIRQQRPLRAATAGDDRSMVFYHGAPFKFADMVKGCHSNYVYGLEFSPDGSQLVSTGADRKVWLYDGKTGESKGQLGAEEHKGSIFGVSWSKDSRKIVTASADRTVKIWDVETAKVTQSWTFGGDSKVVSIPHQQVGVVWPAGRTDGLIISLSLDGDLTYVNEGTEKPTRILQGHQKTISAISTDGPKASTLWTGSYEGRVCSWDLATGAGETIEGDAHKNQVIGFAKDEGSRIYSLGWDDTLRAIDPSAKTFLGDSIKTSAQPRGVATVGKVVVTATITGLEIATPGKGEPEVIKTDFTPTAVAAQGEIVAVGADDRNLYIYSLSGTKLSLKETIECSSGAVSALSFSRSGKYLASGESSGKIIVYSTKDYSIVTNRWSAHVGKVTGISWHEDEDHAASGALDTNVFVWSIANPGKRVKAANAHKEGVGGVAWIGNDKVVSVGADAAVKGWKVMMNVTADRQVLDYGQQLKYGL